MSPRALPSGRIISLYINELQVNIGTAFYPDFADQTYARVPTGTYLTGLEWRGWQWSGLILATAVLTKMVPVVQQREIMPESARSPPTRPVAR